MECEIIYAESKVQLRNFKDRSSFYIVTKKGFIPIQIQQDALIDTLGTKTKIKNCYIDFNGKVVIDKEKQKC